MFDAVLAIVIVFVALSFIVSLLTDLHCF